MSWHRIRVVFMKEMLDIVRDRRAMVFMIVLPIAVVPALMIGMGKLVAFGQKKLMSEPSRVALMGAENAPKVEKLLRALVDMTSIAGAPPEFTVAALEKASDDEVSVAVPKILGEAVDEQAGSLKGWKILELEATPASEEEAKARIRAKDLDALVVCPKGFSSDVEAERPASLAIAYDSSVDRSRLAHRKLRTILETFERGIVLSRLPRHGIGPGVLKPFRVAEESVASKEQEGRAILALILPYMLILMCFSGAVYPAIDLGAGEKERGTLETLLVSPAERVELVVGKFLVVFATSLVAAALNIGSLAFSVRHGVGALGADFPVSVAPLSGAVALVLMLPTAALFAAVLLAVSVFAKSFKEAQSYFVPFNMLIIVPSFFSAIPGVELDVRLSLVPIVNVSLAIKEALSGTYKWGCLAVILVSSAALASAAIAFCASWFKREEVLFRS